MVDCLADYLIDLVAGGSLSVLTFYLLMTDEMRAMGPAQTDPPSPSQQLQSKGDVERGSSKAAFRQEDEVDQDGIALDSRTPFMQGRNHDGAGQ